ncbi:uncharacterized protein MELLADRAFT_104129 [Melampsora larici-populina 98AG31]|uniref:Uncharacterized protein n=1 Tax=Melampsora larici-populina (strain 98AG31 / pathotype 3-4-7) TaxID=747676 RepID=F4RDN8_MELLP|nr:uncharacterized protein MELLADRAFT_104129 [Melampsora larici-populina 98AG31]EGG09572.1 hypothetical protein MELLADRAFT_104129 [Melampsora larici-populina 98AG31]
MIDENTESDPEAFDMPGSEHNKMNKEHPLYFSHGANGRSTIHTSGSGSAEGKKEIARRFGIDFNFINSFDEASGSRKKDDYPSYDSHLVKATNEILLSKKGNWKGNMKMMLDQIKLEKHRRDSVAEIMLFQILAEFLRLNGLPFKVLLVIHLQLLEMKATGNNSAARTNEILLSEKDEWEEMMMKMLDEIKIDTISELEKILLLQVLKGFLSLKKLPSSVPKVIYVKLIELKPIDSMSKNRGQQREVSFDRKVGRLRSSQERSARNPIGQAENIYIYPPSLPVGAYKVEDDELN